MNIADDVYRNQIEDPKLNDEQVDIIVNLAENIDASTAKMVIEKIRDGEINNFNYKASFSKLERMSK